MRVSLWMTVLALSACRGVGSDRDAELAYLGLHEAVGRALELGLRGFSEADSANIPTQEGEGDVSGTMVVDGQVDQGASDNKGLRLSVALTEYADVVDVDDDPQVEVAITYETVGGAPADVDLKLRGIPDGTFEGTFVGTFLMVGDLTDEVTLDLALAGALEPDTTVEGGTQRADGETTVTGTATTARGTTFTVDLAL